MYKASAKQVKLLEKWGQEDPKIKVMISNGFQPQGHTLAYYTPSNANWSYQIGIYMVDGVVFELLTRFGSVEGGRRLHFPEQN